MLRVRLERGGAMFTRFLNWLFGNGEKEPEVLDCIICKIRLNKNDKEFKRKYCCDCRRFGDSLFPY